MVLTTSFMCDFMRFCWTFIFWRYSDPLVMPTLPTPAAVTFLLLSLMGISNTFASCFYYDFNLFLTSLREWAFHAFCKIHLKQLLESKWGGPAEQTCDPPRFLTWREKSLLLDRQIERQSHTDSNRGKRRFIPHHPCMVHPRKLKWNAKIGGL